MADPYLPLRGVTILSWEQAVSLPMATRLLADLGADVIRLEAPARGRVRPRHLGNDLARNKRNLALNLREEEGRALFRTLVQRVDVLCENFTPRVKREFGLTYERLREQRPDLIMLSLSGYGQTGRMAERPSYGPGIEAAAGHAWLTGYPESPPTRPGTIVYADNISGQYAALAILGALFRRRRTGTGCHIDLSMYEANAFHLGASLLASSLTGEPGPRRGNTYPTAAFQDVLPASGEERWLAVTVRPDQVATVSELLNCPADVASVAAALRTWAAERRPEEGAESLQSVGVAAAPVLNARDLLLNPHLRARKAFTNVHHDRPVNHHGQHPHATSPFRFLRWGRPALREARANGQDSEPLVRGPLGQTEEQFNKLVARGVVGVAATRSEPIETITPAEDAQRRQEWHLIAGYDPEPGRTLGLRRVSFAGTLEMSTGEWYSTPSGRGGASLKVLDLTRTIAGAYCAQMLALIGAEVTRVELPGTHPHHPVDALAWEYVNRGKTLITATIAELPASLADADALVMDSGPVGTRPPNLALSRLAEKRLRERSPRLVVTRISEFGQSGPWAGWAGSELVNLAAGGLLFLTGPWERPPVQLAPYQAQLTAGLLGAIATAAALFGGGPATIDLSKQEAILAMITPALTEYAYNGTVPAREGMVAAMPRIERSRDGWVYAGPGAAATADYATFARFLELPELGEERFATPDGRMRNWEEHQRLVLPRLAERTTKEWLDAAEMWRLTFGPVQTTTDLLACDVLAGRHFFAPLPTAEGDGRAPLAPYLVDGERPDALAEPLQLHEP